MREQIQIWLRHRLQFAEELKEACSMVSKPAIMVIGSLVVMCSTAACDRLFEAGGTRRDLSVDILFVDKKQVPMRGLRVVLAERIGTSQQITADLKTDQDGKIHLSGAHCLPVDVASDSGDVVVTAPEILPSYVVVIRPELERPSIEKMYGYPRPAYRDYANRHNDCD